MAAPARTANVCIKGNKYTFEEDSDNNVMIGHVHSQRRTKLLRVNEI